MAADSICRRILCLCEVIMRASELIKELQKIIESDGDLKVGAYQFEDGSYNYTIEVCINQRNGEDIISLE